MLPRRTMLTMMSAAAAIAPFAVTRRAKAAAAPQDLALVDALTWGVSPSTMTEFLSQGREQWLQAQLHPPAEPRLPQDAQQQVNALTIARRPAFALAADFAAAGRITNGIIDPAIRAEARTSLQAAMNDIARQAAAASVLRALYAPDQLRERMTWFWFNHFNVHQYKANIRVLVGDYEHAVIRRHAMGQFPDLLMATLRHPAMLRYLDNADNAAGHLNENYAREIMELHTMGVGSGYTQQDVEQLARILTGAGIDLRPANPKLKPEWQPLLVRDGAFLFNPARHDFSDKTFLGQAIKASGFAEIEQALTLLCTHPATARHIAGKIAVYFVSDDPPAPLIDRMAQCFTQTQGDIASVLDTMIRSSEFTASIGTRFKDPVRYVYSAIRMAYDDKVIANTLPVQSWLNRLAEGLYDHQTPDGYPMESSAWDASGQMMTRFDIARQIGSSSAGLFKIPGANTADEPAFPLLQNALYFADLRGTLSAQTRGALDKATSPQDWNTLFLSSPEFMH